jgi:hypothetical protein
VAHSPHSLRGVPVWVAPIPATPWARTGGGGESPLARPHGPGAVAEERMAEVVDTEAVVRADALGPCPGPACRAARLDSEGYQNQRAVSCIQSDFQHIQHQLIMVT